MATVIRAEISSKNKYWIDKHRYYELKHFCLQYPEWKRAYRHAMGLGSRSIIKENARTDYITTDMTSMYGILRSSYAERIRLIENTAKEADEDLYNYILNAVTEGLSYTYLKSKMDIPCGKDMYYDRYRKFFWLLSKARD